MGVINEDHSGIWSGAFLVLTPMLEHVGYFQVGECTAVSLIFDL